MASLIIAQKSAFLLLSASQFLQQPYEWCFNASILDRLRRLHSVFLIPGLHLRPELSPQIGFIPRRR
jgi:hypothetical protein